MCMARAAASWPRQSGQKQWMSDPLAVEQLILWTSAALATARGIQTIVSSSLRRLSQWLHPGLAWLLRRCSGGSQRRL